MTQYIEVNGEVVEFPDGMSTTDMEKAITANILSVSPKRVGLKGEGYDKAMNYSPKDTFAGLVRGSGSIGATLIRPFETAQENAGRRTAMDEALATLGADPQSMQFKTAKLGAEVAGTWGIGGATSKLISKIPGAVTALPNLLPAIQSGGMTVGAQAPGFLNTLYAMANRVAGGAVNGALTAGAIDPKDAKAGMVIGGAFPVAVKAAGAAGDAVGQALKPRTLNPTMLETARESMDAGYKIPPSMIDPSLKNRTLESMSGKYATAQMMSTGNQKISEGLVRNALGLPKDAPLTFETMKAYRQAQIQAGYEPLRQVGPIPAGPQFNQALDDIVAKFKGGGTIPAIADSKKEVIDLVNSYKSQGFDTGDAVDAIKTLREDASSLFASTSAADKAKARATKSIADAFERAIDDALTASGQNDLLAAYRAARKNIAMSGSVEKAIREGSGTLDARKLASQLQNKKAPLTGDLLTVAKFANTFDKAAQPPHLIGSPDVGALRNWMSMLSAGGGGAIGSVLGPAGGAAGAIAGSALPYVVPPLARARMFSDSFQRGLLKTPSASSGLLQLGIDEMLPAMYRINPAVGTGLIGP